MILVDKEEIINVVAVSTQDMPVQPTTITLKNLQTKEVTTHPVYDVRTNERTAIYQFYLERAEITPVYQNVTYLTEKDGMYEYCLGSEIGLFQIGRPQLDKQTYTNNPTNDVYYNN